MNTTRLWLSLGLGLAVGSSALLQLASPVRAQSNNFSDVTGNTVTNSAPVSGSVGTAARQVVSIIPGIDVSLEAVRNARFASGVQQSLREIALGIIANPPSGDVTVGTVSGQPTTVNVDPAAGREIVDFTLSRGLDFPGIRGIQQAIPGPSASIGVGAAQNLLNSNTPAGNLFRTLIGTDQVTQSTPVVANAAILVLAQQGLLERSGNVNAGKLIIAVRAYNALVTALRDSGVSLDNFPPQLKAVQAVLGQLVDKAFASAPRNAQR